MYTNSHLNLAKLEARIMQIIIDLHDAARLSAEADIGVSTALRAIASNLSTLAADIRRLLCTDVDSTWSTLQD